MLNPDIAPTGYCGGGYIRINPTKKTARNLDTFPAGKTRGDTEMNSTGGIGTGTGCPLQLKLSLQYVEENRLRSSSYAEAKQKEQYAVKDGHIRRRGSQSGGNAC